MASSTLSLTSDQRAAYQALAQVVAFDSKGLRGQTVLFLAATYHLRARGVACDCYCAKVGNPGSNARGVFYLEVAGLKMGLHGKLGDEQLASQAFGRALGAGHSMVQYHQIQSLLVSPNSWLHPVDQSRLPEIQAWLNEQHLDIVTGPAPPRSRHLAPRRL